MLIDSNLDSDMEYIIKCIPAKTIKSLAKELVEIGFEMASWHESGKTNDAGA